MRIVLFFGGIMLSREDVQKYIMQVEGWKLVDDTIVKDFKFKDFKEAVAFVNKVAESAEELNHHPDILLWNWNQVKLTLSTHKVKGLSKNDFELASKIDKIKM